MYRCYTVHIVLHEIADWEWYDQHGPHYSHMQSFPTYFTFSNTSIPISCGNLKQRVEAASNLSGIDERVPLFTSCVLIDIWSNDNSHQIRQYIFITKIAFE